MEIIRRYPLLFIAFAWLIGLLIGEWIVQAWLIAVPAFVIGAALIAGSYRLFVAHSRRWLILLLCGFLLLGVARDLQYNITHKSALSEQGAFVGASVEMRGYIDTDPVLNGDLLKFMMKPVNAKHERVLVNLYLKHETDVATVGQWERGMGIMLSGTFAEINLSSNPGQFNYQQYLAHEHVYHKIMVVGIENISLSATSAADYRLNIIRSALTGTFDQLFTKAEAGFLKSILLGESGDIPAELREDFAITGLAHILAISGLHLSIITMLLFGILLRLRMTRENAAAVVMLVLVIYLILIGLRPSVVRATIMSLLMLYGIIFRNKIISLQTIGVALFIMSLYNPLWIYNVGFQLSFTITFFILFAFPEVERRMKEWYARRAPVENKWQSKIISAIALVATTQLASFPIIFYNFHQYSLISWLANFVIVPVFSTLILPFALLILILGTINLTFVIVLAAVMSHILQLMFRAIEWSASLTGLHFYGNIASGFAVLIFYITLTWLIFRSQLKVAFISFRSKQLIFQTEKISALILAIVLLVAALLPNPTEITFIDVGQGDSAFIRTTTGQTILIDSGGTLDYAKEPWQQRDNPFEVGARIVWPFLRYEGVNQLDYALLTHEDVDHLRGFFAVLEKVKVDIFIVPAGFPQTNLGRQLAAQLTTKQIPTYQVEQAVSINIDDTSKLTLLPAVLVNSTKANDRSYAILAEFHNSRIIFAADIESSGEELLLDKYQLPSVDILKVGHHGSRSSTTEKWLAALQPNNAIISVGSNNCYGHPAPEVLERLAESGARPATIIWRTDLQGSVQVKIIGDKVQISQFGR